MAKDKVKPTVGISSQYRFFTWVILFMVSAQLLVGLDYATIWSGAEIQHIWQSMGQKTTTSLSSILLGLIPETSEYWLLFYRLPGLLLYVLAAALFYRWGKSLFGQTSVQSALLVLGGSLFLPIMAKIASLDVWTMVFELATWLSILHFQKEASKKWLLKIALFGSLAVLFGQIQSVGLLLVWQVLYYRMSASSNEQFKSHFAKPFVIIYLVFAISYIFMGHSTRESYYFNAFDFKYHQFLLFSLLGLAPFIGFCMASLRDLVYKLKRGEELAKILAIGLVGSFLTQSLVFPFLLVFMTAKQMQHFFQQPNYPWHNWVKTWQVLHLITVFIAVVLALIGGFASFQTDGFRAVLGCSFAYWMFSFVAVIGLYGFRRDYVIAGMTLAGALALLFFWIQVYPFLHLKRNWPERMVIQLEKLEDVKTLTVDNESLCIAPYLKRADFEVLNTEKDTTSALQVYKISEQDTSSTPIIKIEGWSGLWQEGTWGVSD